MSSTLQDTRAQRNAAHARSRTAPDMSSCPLLAQSGHALLHCTCPLLTKADIGFLSLTELSFKSLRCLVLRLGGGHETARLHQSNCWLSGNLAACRSRAAADCAGNRLSQRPIQSRSSRTDGKINRGLHEMGAVDGQNVTIEYRGADGQYDRLPALATELVRRPVDVIVARVPPAALAAKAATTTISIVFVVGFDPIAAGLVESLSQPSGNATGMTLMTAPLSQKRIEGLRELVPKAAAIAMLANPVSPD